MKEHPPPIKKKKDFEEGGTEILSKKNRVKKAVKHYDFIFLVNNSKVFYLVNNTEFVTRVDLIIEKHTS